jgi:hypothetical protein
VVHAILVAVPRDGIDIEGHRFRSYLVDVSREELAKVQRETGTALETVVEPDDVAPVVRRNGGRESRGFGRDRPRRAARAVRPHANARLLDHPGDAVPGDQLLERSVR